MVWRHLFAGALAALALAWFATEATAIPYSQFPSGPNLAAGFVTGDCVPSDISESPSGSPSEASPETIGIGFSCSNVAGVQGTTASITGQAVASNAGTVASLKAIADLSVTDIVSPGCNPPCAEIATQNAWAMVEIDFTVIDLQPGAPGGVAQVPIDFLFAYDVEASWDQAYQPFNAWQNVATVYASVSDADDGFDAASAGFVGANLGPEQQSKSGAFHFQNVMLALDGTSSLKGTMTANVDLRGGGHARAWIDPIVRFSPGFAHTDRYQIVANPSLALVPEPSTALLLGIGLIGLASRRRSGVPRSSFRSARTSSDPST